MRQWISGLAAVLALAACSKPAPSAPTAQGVAAEAEPVNPTPPASAPAIGGIDLSSEIRASGTATKWDLDIGTDQLKLTRPGKPDVAAKNGGPEMGPDKAVWTVTASDGTPLVITLVAQKCLGLGGISQPLTVTVSSGVETLKGCGTGGAVQASAGTPPTGAPIDAE